MNTEQMIDTISRQNEVIQEKDSIISKLVHLLADKNQEVQALQVALWELNGDDEMFVFEPDWETPSPH